MRENMALLRWLETAVSGIRFKPDRLAVRAELYAHLEDRTLDLMRLFPDMDPDEARDQALSRMGDPEELKRELARVHRPWLGYLWQASRWLVWGLMALCLVLLVNWHVEGRAGDLWNDWEDLAEGREWSETLFSEEDPTGERVALLAPAAEAKMGPGTLSAPKAALWHHQPHQGEYILYAQVRITWDRPWDASWTPFGYIAAEDDRGKKLPISSTSWGREAGLSWRQWNYCVWGVSPDAKWIKLTYLSGSGVGPELIVDLTREVEP